MLTLENSAQIFNALSDLPGEILDPEELIKVISSVQNILLPTCTVFWFANKVSGDFKDVY